MGCTNSKVAALQELEQIIRQLTIENEQLGIERNKLKSHHDDRPEEEKDSLQDLRSMHSDLEKEIKELKEIMCEFLPVPEQKDSNFLLIKNSIEKITQVQLELDEQCELLEEMVVRRKNLGKEHESLEKVIAQTEKQIEDIESTIENQENSLNGQDFDNPKRQFERQRTLMIEELRGHDNYLMHEDDKIEEVDENSTSSDKQTYETLLTLSELEINKELSEVENELNDLNQQIKELDLTDVELQQMRNYIDSLNNKLISTAKNSKIKEQIQEFQQEIEKLKIEKRELKQEVLGLKKYSKTTSSQETNKKIQALNEILLQKHPISDGINRNSMPEDLVFDIQETLKKARNLSSSIKLK